ncbi:membrane-bound PQQ-dependent dehydrogenase, glucose/quinate/shikimate family [Novosphingobium sp. 9]|uniref:membrane-bound PQQ-dependent dehydrogenase, glucose/quinate/shikimate family n=1 Tax=Novosphingobium sp. 9 TaxID=2025349 RepID=UPI0028CB88CC|nr:membrane-bound PQQ-dependent dehydrogenase, glucose/quinate/shikimate family [Novosphingobium sp. 9]
MEILSAPGSAPRSRTGLWLKITSVLVLLIAVVLVVAGGWLAALGGSVYYVIAGAAMAVTALLLWRGHRFAYPLYALIIAATMVWAVSEAGFDFWRLAARGDVLVPLGIWLLLPWVVRAHPAGTRPLRWPLGAVLAIAVCIVGFSLTRDSVATVGNLPGVSGPVNLADGMSPDDWQAYGRDNAGKRFSPLTQITPENADKLQVAWTFRTGDMPALGKADPVESTFEVTPIKIGNLVYLCSPHQIVFALDAATGKQVWKYDPKLQANNTFQHLTCRGLAYHAAPANAVDTQGKPVPAQCRQSVFLPTNDGRMIALDALTGRPCEDFGAHGTLNLNQSMNVTEKGFLEGTSPPVATKQILIVTGAVTDNYSTNEPSGAVRGYDIYTGRLVWAWDPGAKNENQLPSATHHFTPNSPNSWIVSSADEKLGLVYIPTGVETPDIFGGNRKPDNERYASSIVALDIATGKRVWSYQTVHHDLWDMDVPSQPTLMDVQTAHGMVPAIYAPAKTGNIFVLDRRTGKPIVPAPEKAVPQGAVAGDWLSKTQPFSELSLRPKDNLTDANMWGATMFDQLACRIMFKRLRYEGPFTPPSLQGTLVFPGNLGMFEWGGISVDPQRQIAITNPMTVPFVSKLMKRGPDNPSHPTKDHPAGSETGVQPMYGTPYGVNLSAFLSPLGMPCMQPPWGYVAGIDLKTNKVIWQHRVGTTQDAGLPLPLKIGVPMLGGTITTGGASRSSPALWTTISALSTSPTARWSGSSACRPAASQRR